VPVDEGPEGSQCDQVMMLWGLIMSPYSQWLNFMYPTASRDNTISAARTLVVVVISLITTS